MTEPEGNLFSPPDLMGSLLADTPSLMEQFQSLVLPIREQRDAVRQYFLDEGMITELPEDVAPYTVGCTDGAYIVNPLALGDHLSTFSVALAQNDGQGGVGVVDYRSWSALRAHSADAQTLTKAVMMADEVGLLSSLPSEGMVRLIDGSWITPLIAIHLGLASNAESVREAVIEAVESRGVIEAAEDAAQSPLVAACPKSDSSLGLWQEAQEHVSLESLGLPDKVLASLVLEDGEVLTSDRATPSWSRLHMTQGQVQDPKAKTVSDRLSAATEPLRTGHVQVVHAKPYGSAQAIRVETHPGLDPFEVDGVVQSICSTVHAPHVQEPLAQYLADDAAKLVSIAAQTQMEVLRQDLASNQDMDYFEYLVRQYRTA